MENVVRLREINLFGTNNTNLRDKSSPITYATGINSRVLVIHDTLFSNGLTLPMYGYYQANFRKLRRNFFTDDRPMEMKRLIQLRNLSFLHHAGEGMRS